MKMIGLIGGMSWESSLEYYRLINTMVRERLGGSHSARTVMVSVDFAEIEALQERGDWDLAGETLIEAAIGIEQAGGECVVICTNTMHVVAEQVEAAIDIPLIHIADATATAITAAGHHRVGLLGTLYTMEQDFYRGRLTDRHQLAVLIPEESDRRLVHDIIYSELVKGVIRDESRTSYVAVIDRLVAAGAEAIILGCTEIGLLVDEAATGVPLYDTTALHAAAAVSWAFGA